jgi:polyisoprenyl-teichoic acid--peptidoglycan teichoic acid transferase
MKNTRRLLWSTGLGLMLGFCFLTTMGGAFAFMRLGLLSSAWPGGSQGRTSPTAVHDPGVSVSLPDPLPTAAGATCGGPKHMVIALLGVDDRSKSEEGYTHPTRTDAIVLVNVRFDTPSATMLSFPRDLHVPLANLENTHPLDRINTAYMYGEIYEVPGGGPAEFKATMELNFAIRVDRYIMVNFGAFVKAVDALGGIEVDVPDAIYDPNFPNDVDDGSIILEIPAGRQQMDGQMALRYARTRHQDDDYHRVKRQQLVLLAIRDKLFSPEVIPQIPALLDSMKDSVQTDLSASEIAALACLGPQIDNASITARSIDGTMVIPWTTPTGGRVSIPNREVIAPLIEEFIGE